ncbi:MAG: ABC transporter permease [Rikenellaceae bacterium]|jgi:hypothetical protein|nr:ABC transporter permease [Rikenellaceae bacterium]
MKKWEEYTDDDFIIEHSPDDEPDAFIGDEPDRKDAFIGDEPEEEEYDAFIGDEGPRGRMQGREREHSPMREREREGDAPQPEEEEGEDDFAEKREPSKLREYLGAMLSGNILSKAEVRRLYPYLLFVAALMLLYISNVFAMQQLHHRRDMLEAEVRELRAKSLTLSSMRMNATRQSVVAEELERRGSEVKESFAPPKVAGR